MKNSLDDKNVCFVSLGQNIHDSNQYFADVLNADIKQIKSDGKRIFFRPSNYSFKEYDIVVVGDAYIFRLVAARKRLRNDFRLYRLISEVGYKRIVQEENHLTGLKWASKQVDGAIAVSDFIKQFANKFIDEPIEVVNPPITKYKYKKLAELEYEPNNDALWVGRPIRTKGIDLFYEAIPEVTEIDSLRLLGEPTEYSKDFSHSKITQVGYKEKDDFIAEFKKAGLYIHPSRSDSFGVASIEAMRAGIPCLVSSQTGSKKYVQEVDSNLVFEPNVSSMVESIRYFLKLENEVKKEYSRQFREISKRFSPSTKSKEFVKSLRYLEGYNGNR